MSFTGFTVPYFIFSHLFKFLDLLIFLFIPLLICEEIYIPITIPIINATTKSNNKKKNASFIIIISFG